MRPRVVMCALIAALFALHAAIAWLAPIATDDWDILIWAKSHRSQPFIAWLHEFFVKHHTLADLVNFAIAKSSIAHALLTPLAGLAVVFGTFAIALRRLPRFDSWDDVLAIIVISALIWLAGPRIGLVYAHRPYAAAWLYGTAATLWLFAPLRCGWHPRGAWIALLVLGGFLVGSATRQLGMFSLVAFALAMRKERAPWMWAVLATLAIGLATGLVRGFFDFTGFTLSGASLFIPVGEACELITLVLGFVMVQIVAGTLWPRLRATGVPETPEALRWLPAWFAYVLIALLGPRYSEAILFPATILLVIAALPVARWLLTTPMRPVVLGLAVGTNLIAWTLAIAKGLPIYSEYRERVAHIKAAPRGSVVTIPPYHQIRPTFFSYGEDLQDAARRQLIAVELYRLRDIELVPAFRRMELNPALAVRLEVEGVTPEQLRRAGAPDQFATTLKTARTQFDNVIATLRENLSTPFAARLVVDRDIPVAHGRKLIAAIYENGKQTTLRVTRKPQDDHSRQNLVVRPSGFITKLSEAYLVIGPRVTPIEYDGGYKVQVLTTEVHAVIACEPERCFFVDAFIPAL